MSRKDYIQSIIDKYRGRFTQNFIFDNDGITYIPYEYDSITDCLVSGNVSVPFHYGLEEINCSLLDKKLDELEDLVIDYYKTYMGIELQIPID